MDNIVLKSENGTNYSITISNEGKIQVSPINLENSEESVTEQVNDATNSKESSGLKLDECEEGVEEKEEVKEESQVVVEQAKESRKEIEEVGHPVTSTRLVSKYPKFSTYNFNDYNKYNKIHLELKTGVADGTIGNGYLTTDFLDLSDLELLQSKPFVYSINNETDIMVNRLVLFFYDSNMMFLGNKVIGLKLNLEGICEVPSFALSAQYMRVTIANNMTTNLTVDSTWRNAIAIGIQKGTFEVILKY